MAERNVDRVRHRNEGNGSCVTQKFKVTPATKAGMRNS